MTLGRAERSRTAEGNVEEDTAGGGKVSKRSYAGQRGTNSGFPDSGSFVGGILAGGS